MVSVLCVQAPAYPAGEVTIRVCGAAEPLPGLQPGHCIALTGTVKGQAQVPEQAHGVCMHTVSQLLKACCEQSAAAMCLPKLVLAKVLLCTQWG